MFEGVDENGDPAPVIWTPGFDLEGWYNEDYNPFDEPQFYTSDTNASCTHTYVCFAAGTLIDTSARPVRIEDLREGDDVLTLDAGPRPVIWSGRRTCLGYDRAAPVRFEPGVIGNAGPLYLSQNHRVLLRAPQLDLTLGCSEVLVPAKALTRIEGITLSPQPTVTYAHILLPAHHVICANGALCKTLLVGPETQRLFRANSTFQRALRAHGLNHDRHLPARSYQHERRRF